MMIEAVAWDIDGTLVDSEPLHDKALQQVCARHGFDISGLLGDAFLGVHMHEIWLALRPHLPLSLERDVWLAEINAYYIENSHEVIPQPGAVEVVRALAARGIRQVCVSNAERLIVDANLRALGIDDILLFSLSFDDVSAGKPDPEPYRTACERLGLRPEQVMAVEDSGPGMQSARAAGVQVIGYRPGGGPMPQADTVITSLAQVPLLPPALTAA